MKYRYVGKCRAGFVRFERAGESVVMPAGEAVDVPGWLGKKLAANNHFEAVAPEVDPAVEPAAMPSETVSYPSEMPDETDAPVVVRRGPGRPRKFHDAG